MNIGVIGVGKLGLAYALMLEEKGFNVIASSYKKDYVEQLTSKTLNITEPGITELLNKSNIEFTVDNHYVIDNCDFIYIMVATPSNPAGDYDVSAVFTVAHDILNHPTSVEGKILVVGSTVNPGTCEQIQEMLKSKGVSVVYSPTFVAQGSVLYDMLHAENLLIGTDNPEVAEQCRKVFSTVSEDDTPVFITSLKTSEILKIAGNCKAILSISYYNMIAKILVDAGVKDELEIANRYLNSTKNNRKVRHGFGFGGPCYPRDNRSFVHYTNKIGSEYRVGSIVDNFNVEYVDFLSKFFLEDNADNLPFYFEYVSYKKGVSIFEESQQLQVCKALLNSGATVYVEDTKFLLPEIKQELKQISDKIEFINVQNLVDQNISFYDIMKSY